MKKAFNLALALFPIISGYGFSPSLDFGSLLLFFLGAGCVVAYPKKFKIKFPLGYMAFFVVALLLSLVWTHSVPLRVLLFSINLCFACSYAKWDYLWKYYGIIVWISCAFFLIQEASYLLLGSRPSGLLSFIPTIYGDNGDMIGRSKIDLRSAAFFLEPSYFAQFLLPYVIVNLFSIQKGNVKRAVVISMIIVLIRSGMGVLCVALIWLMWFLYSNVKLHYKIIVLVLGASVFGVLVFTNSSILYALFGRAGELMSYGGDETYMSSGFIRFFRGYYAFTDMSALNMLFGANPQIVQDTLSRNIFFWSDEIRFLNGVQTLLFYHGIIGAVLYLSHLLSFPYRTHNKILLVFSVCFILLMLGESYFLCSRGFLMVIIMQSIAEGARVGSNSVQLVHSK